MSNIADKVKAIIVDQLGVDESQVVPVASFTNDLGAAPTDLVVLMGEFEKEFDIYFREGEAEEIKTVSDIIYYLEEALDD